MSSPGRVLATAKHFVGDGGTRNGVDRGDTVVDEATLRRLHLAGYVAAIKAGVGSIMVSYNSWNGEKMHGNRRLITDMLKGELGFRGIVISDWNGIDELPGTDGRTNRVGGERRHRHDDGARQVSRVHRRGEVPRRERAASRSRGSTTRSAAFSPSSSGWVCSNGRSEIRRSWTRSGLRSTGPWRVRRSGNHRYCWSIAATCSRSSNGFEHPRRRPRADDLGMECGGWTIS